MLKELLRKRISVVDDNKLGWAALCELTGAFRGRRVHVRFDFDQCGTFSQQGVAAIGALARMIEANGGSAKFDWDTCRPALMNFFRRNGFSAAFGGPVGQSFGNSIPFRHDPNADEDAVLEYLGRHWLDRGWVLLSKSLRGEVLGRAIEMYVNAFEHSDSPMGVVTCGQLDRKLNEVRLTVLDLGIGIPQRVRRHLKDEGMPAAQALKWAFRAGNTTADTNFGRGLGLDILKDFVKVNGGRMSIQSHDGMAEITSDGESFAPVDSVFHGTVVTIALRKDRLLYRLATESGN